MTNYEFLNRTMPSLADKIKLELQSIITEEGYRSFTELYIKNLCRDLDALETKLSRLAKEKNEKEEAARLAILLEFAKTFKPRNPVDTAKKWAKGET